MEKQRNDFLSALKLITTVQEQVDITPLLNIRIGGRCAYVVEPTTVDELKDVIQCAKTHHIPYTILGHGYNTMFVNEGYDGLVIRIDNHFAKMKQTSPTTIVVEAGCALFDVCLFAKSLHLSGLEFAYGIPGSIGGVTYMNAGAFNGEMKDVIKSVTFLDEVGQIMTKQNSDLCFSYRSSLFMNHDYVVLFVEIELEHGIPEEIEVKMNYNLKRRHDKQPLDYPNAGSTFKRPVGSYASLLIDQCGLKGFQLGGAMVSDKHAGFLINYDHATSDDMLSLIDHIKKTVKKQTGFELECEIEIIK